MANVVTQVGKGGAVVIPDTLRRQFGLEEGSVLIAEERPDGILLRLAGIPAELLEDSTPERVAEFLLNNACSGEDYAWAREEAQQLGVDPDQVPHGKPPGA